MSGFLLKPLLKNVFAYEICKTLGRPKPTCICIFLKRNIMIGFWPDGGGGGGLVSMAQDFLGCSYMYILVISTLEISLLAMSKISKRSGMKLRSWHFLKVEVKRTLFIPKFQKKRSQLALFKNLKRFFFKLFIFKTG